MTAKLGKALNRLKSILPLKDRQDACSKQIKELHQQVLRSFVDKGRILTREEMGQHVSNLEAAISVLKEKDMLVFSDDGNPVGAYPFTMEEREHVVRVRGHQVSEKSRSCVISRRPLCWVDCQTIWSGWPVSPSSGTVSVS